MTGDMRGGSGTRRVLEVLVAAPADVSAEKRAVLGVIQEFNDVWSKYIGIFLGSLTWEISVTPGLGVDGQDVVNRQIGDTYDLFVGLMGDRIGTPTARAKSGTIEEYQRARDRNKASKGHPEVFFYFRKLDQTHSPDRAEVGEFKRQVGYDGALYWEFEDERALERFARLHISRFVQRRARSGPSDGGPSKSPRQVEAILRSPGVAKAGVLVGESKSEMENAADSARRLSDLLSTVDQKTRDTTTRLQHATRPGFRPPPGGATGVARRFAPSLQRFAIDVEEHGGLMLRSYVNAVESIGGSVSILAPMPWIPASLRAQISGVGGQISRQLEILEDFGGQLSTVQSSLAGWRRIPAELSAARDAAIQAIEGLRRTVASTTYEANEVVEILRDFASAETE